MCLGKYDSVKFVENRENNQENQGRKLNCFCKHQYSTTEAQVPVQR